MSSDYFILFLIYQEENRKWFDFFLVGGDKQTRDPPSVFCVSFCKALLLLSFCWVSLLYTNFLFFYDK